MTWRKLIDSAIKVLPSRTLKRDIVKAYDNVWLFTFSFKRFLYFHQGRISRGIHGLLKWLLWPVMPYQSTPCGWPPLKWPYSSFWGSYPQGKQPKAVLQPAWMPYVIRLCILTCLFMFRLLVCIPRLNWWILLIRTWKKPLFSTYLALKMVQFQFFKKR